MIIISRLVRVPHIPTVIAHCSDLRHVSIIGVTCHVNIRDSGRARINIWLGWALSCSRWSPLINIPLHKFPRPVSQPHSNNNTDYRCAGWCIDMMGMGRHGLVQFKTISINDNVTQWVNVESGPLRLKRVLLFIPLKNSLFHPTRRIISFWVGVKKEYSLFSFLYSLVTQRLCVVLINTSFSRETD